MIKLFLKTIVLLFALLLFNCENNDPEEQLPPITQTGANTFGAIVDGRIFVPKTTISSTPGGSLIKGLEVYVGSNFFDSKGDDKWFISTYNSEDSPSIYIYILTNTFR